MTNPPDLDTAIALSRFGLGARQGGAGFDSRGARLALRDEITGRRVAIPNGPELRPTRDILVEFFEFQKERVQERKASAAAPTRAPADNRQAGSASAPQQPNAMARNLPQQVFLAEVDARFNRAYRDPQIGFGERLVLFWANHFAVAAGKGPQLHVLAGAFEREAIRPHVFGRFEDMLLAVETHPAMLMFLDNQQSVGPDSKVSQNGKRGLNENLAREIMELHTLGVDGGYSQRDVTSLSKIITGWTVAGGAGKIGDPGTFAFVPAAHEPGAQTVLGVSYPDSGFGQGRAALLDLAHHR